MENIKKIRGYNAKKLQKWWKLLPECIKCGKKRRLLYKNKQRICIDCYNNKTNNECIHCKEGTPHQYYSNIH